MKNYTDVLIIGAGPAGCAAAITLIRAGVRVVLADQCAFPREKTCGDALMPDSLRALHSLGVGQSILSRALKVSSLRVYPPNSSHFTLNGPFATLSRHDLDSALLDAARAAGADLLSPYRLSTPLFDNGAVCGAVFQQSLDGRVVAVRSTATILATGAAVLPLELFGVAERLRASAVAYRAYFNAPDWLLRDLDFLSVCYHHSVSPGYGWIFPLPNGVLNVGVGTFGTSSRRQASPSLRELWSRFLARFPGARTVALYCKQISRGRGAPLRTGMKGSLLARPGLLVVGEAAGLTYSLTGEGIGKSLESGIIAGDEIVKAFHSGCSNGAESLAHSYSARIGRTFRGRFRGYDSAARWLQSPRIFDLLAKRAIRGRFVRSQLEGLVAETTDPRQLFSTRGLFRSFWS